MKNDEIENFILKCVECELSVNSIIDNHYTPRVLVSVFTKLIIELTLEQNNPKKCFDNLIELFTKEREKKNERG